MGEFKILSDTQAVETIISILLVFIALRLKKMQGVTGVILAGPILWMIRKMGVNIYQVYKKEYGVGDKSLVIPSTGTGPLYLALYSISVYLLYIYR